MLATVSHETAAHVWDNWVEGRVHGIPSPEPNPGQGYEKKRNKKGFRGPGTPSF